MTDVLSACLPTGSSWPLPPYSPKLDSVERVRLYLIERFLSHKLQYEEKLSLMILQGLAVPHRRSRPHQIALRSFVHPKGQD